MLAANFVQTQLVAKLDTTVSPGNNRHCTEIKQPKAGQGAGLHWFITMQVSWCFGKRLESVTSTCNLVIVGLCKLTARHDVRDRIAGDSAHLVRCSRRCRLESFCFRAYVHPLFPVGLVARLSRWIRQLKATPGLRSTHADLAIGF
jgi:hypothetical protein